MTDEQPPSRRSARRSEGSQPNSNATGKSVEPRGGLFAAIRKRPTAWLFSTLAVVFVLLGTVAVFAGVAMGSTPPPASTPEETQVPPRPQPSAASTPAQLRTCSVADLASDPRLMKLGASVLVAETGEQLYGKRATGVLRTGSVLKVLTASAAIETLGADYQITTKVVSGSVAGSIVLIGHGDPTLSAMPPGTESVYTGAPKLSTLAAEV
ncbi:MAG: D-alanyl-D-alanine carboxypeptidase, partial [Leifsonia sp.]